MDKPMAIITITTPFNGEILRNIHEIGVCIGNMGLVDTIQYHKKKMVRDQAEYMELADNEAHQHANI